MLGTTHWDRPKLCNMQHQGSALDPGPRSRQPCYTDTLVGRRSVVARSIPLLPLAYVVCAFLLPRRLL